MHQDYEVFLQLILYNFSHQTMHEFLMALNSSVSTRAAIGRIPASLPGPMADAIFTP